MGPIYPWSLTLLVLQIVLPSPVTLSKDWAKVWCPTLAYIWIHLLRKLKAGIMKRPGLQMQKWSIVTVGPGVHALGLPLFFTLYLLLLPLLLILTFWKIKRKCSLLRTLSSPSDCEGLYSVTCPLRGHHAARFTAFLTLFFVGYIFVFTFSSFGGALRHLARTYSDDLKLAWIK